MSMLQVAESIERVKAVRLGPTVQATSLDQTNCLDHVPYVLRRPYKSLIRSLTGSSSGKGSTKIGIFSLSEKTEQEIPFNGKEFLLTFDPVLGLEDFWVDAALFHLFNLLRSDMARRQNFGRGLPIQLSKGYSSQRLKNITFGVEHHILIEAEPATPNTSSKKGGGAKGAAKQAEENPNVFAELELEELNQLSVKYGHDSASLQFCHHCKQFKRKVIFAKCNFASKRHKMVYPNSV